jgi:arylsulfatase A-like enzyme
VFKDDSVGPYVEKPSHPFFTANNGKSVNLKYQSRQRQFYDEFILYADSELGRLYDALDRSGELENTWFIFTSDHGEMCERGIFGHRTPVLYQPVIRIPLVIVEPGQSARRDIFTSTSAVDVLPTLLKITGQEVPNWAEGKVLQPFSDVPVQADRSVYALEATASDANSVLNPATAMLVKGKYKLTYYFGYEELQKNNPLFELYDVENDPEELQNIYDPSFSIAQELKTELVEKIKEVDKPYQKI